MPFPIHLILDEANRNPRKALAIGLHLGVDAFALRLFNEDRYPFVSVEDQHWVEEMHDRGTCRFDAMTPGINKSTFDPENGASQLLEDFTFCLERARRIGVRHISLFSWAKTTGAIPPATDKVFSPCMPVNAIVDALRRIADLADTADISVSIEVAYQCWGDTGRRVANLLEAVNHPRLRMLWDPVNSLCGRIWWTRTGPKPSRIEDPMEVLLDELNAVAKWIVEVHVRDVTLTERDWTYVGLGRGCVDWKRLIHALRANGYCGPLTVEHHLLPQQKEEATHHSVAELRRLMTTSD